MENFRFIPNPLLRFEVQVAEHCNLNCRNCMHYAPLAEEQFLDLAEYEQDLKCLSELFTGEMEWIRLMGGEPLLHPDISSIINITRQYFPYGHIRIVTNGILIDKMNDGFWTCCRDNKAEIWMTKYPISLDYGEIKQQIEDKGVIAGLYGAGEERPSTMWRFPINPQGDFDPVQNYYHCDKANICLTLRHGKLYTCATAAHAHHLIEYYNLPVCDSPRNGVDINSVKDAYELMEKLTRPIPFCRYCDYGGYTEYEDEWAVSEKFRYEWMSFNWSDDDIEYLKEASAVYVFGAGNWGRDALQRLSNAGVAVKGVLVSRSEGNPTAFGYIPVLAAEEINPDKDDVCLIAVAGEAKKKIQKLLVQQGFKRIIPLVRVV